ncbi:MAG: PriCT-2 domain-containing protein, partial [Acetobacteraceae bacterium]
MGGVHRTGAVLEWECIPGINWARDGLMAVTEDQIDALFAEIEATFPGWHVSSAPRDEHIAAGSNVVPLYAAAPEDEIAKIHAAPAVVPNPSLDYDRWVKIGHAVSAGSGHSEEEFAAWGEWSAPFSSALTCAQNRKRDLAHPRSITVGTLYAEADAADPVWRERLRRDAVLRRMAATKAARRALTAPTARTMFSTAGCRASRWRRTGSTGPARRAARGRR